MKNVYGNKLQVFSINPNTKTLRDGYIYNETHILCSVVTQKFLDYTKSKGNDLTKPQGNFPGLKPGDHYCLCVLKWIEAYENGVAPLIDLKNTEESVLKYIPYEILQEYSFNQKCIVKK